MLQPPRPCRRVYLEPACRKRVSGDAAACAAARSQGNAYQASHPILASRNPGRNLPRALLADDLPPRLAMGGHRLRFLPWFLRAAVFSLCTLAGTQATV